MALFHDARRPTDHHARDGLRVEGMLALEVLDGRDHGLLGDVSRVRLQRGRLDGPCRAEPFYQLLQARRRRERIEVAVAALEDRRRTAHALSGQQRALQAELTGAAEVQAFGVAAAPRELEKPGTRRARDAQRIGEPVLVEAVELADRGRGAE